MKTRYFAVIGLCGIASAIGIKLYHQHGNPFQAITPRVLASVSEAPAAVRSLRLRYPYSIIPGGAYSPAELRGASERDQLIREHYIGFDMPSTRLVTLTTDRYQYVSFRLNNKVFWTKKRLLIPKGEVLMTDGTNYARTRCGNRLSNIAMSPTTMHQPPERLLGFPPLPDVLPKLDLTSAPPLGDLAQQLPAPARVAPVAPAVIDTGVKTPEIWAPLSSAPSFTPVSTSPGFTPSPRTPGPAHPQVIPPNIPPVAPVPEPATLSLLLVVSLGTAPWLLARGVSKKQDA